jgi:hypothetical protein
VPVASSNPGVKLARTAKPPPPEDYDNDGSLPDSPETDGSSASCSSDADSDASWLRPRPIPPPRLIPLSNASLGEEGWVQPRNVSFDQFGCPTKRMHDHS